MEIKQQLENSSKYLELLYIDEFNLYDYMTIGDEFGAEFNVLNENPIISNVKCKMSFQTLDSSTLYDDINPNSTLLRIITNPINVKSGTFCRVKRENVEYSGNISSPATYFSHTEFFILDNGTS
jgi:hypothetical protein